MRCELLQLLVNGDIPTSPWFTPVSPFDPVTASAEATAVRDILKITAATSDYFAMSVLRCLVGTPTLLHEFGIESAASMAWQLYRNPRLQLPQTITLMPDRNGAPEANRQVSDWPVSVDFQLLCVEPKTARISCGGRSEQVRASFTNEDLFVEWPAWVGLKGALRFLDGVEHWTPSYTIAFKNIPANYPARAALAAIQKTTEWLTLLEKQNLLQHYMGAGVDVTERMALVALALIRDTRMRITHEQ